MIIMEIDSMPNEDGTVTTTAEFEHDGVYGCYIETVDERNDKNAYCFGVSSYGS